MATRDDPFREFLSRRQAARRNEEPRPEEFDLSRPPPRPNRPQRRPERTTPPRVSGPANQDRNARARQRVLERTHGFMNREGQRVRASVAPVDEESQRRFVEQGLSRGAIDPQEVGADGVPVFNNESIARRVQDGRLADFAELDRQNKEQRRGMTSRETFNDVLQRTGSRERAAAEAEMQNASRGRDADLRNATAQETQANAMRDRVPAQNELAQAQAKNYEEQANSLRQNRLIQEAALSVGADPDVFGSQSTPQQRRSTGNAAATLLDPEADPRDVSKAFENLDTSYKGAFSTASEQLGMTPEQMSSDFQRWYMNGVEEGAPGFVPPDQADPENISTAAELFLADRVVTANNIRNEREGSNVLNAGARAGIGRLLDIVRPGEGTPIGQRFENLTTDFEAQFTTSPSQTLARGIVGEGEEARINPDLALAPQPRVGFFGGQGQDPELGRAGEASLIQGRRSINRLSEREQQMQARREQEARRRRAIAQRLEDRE